MGGGRYLHVLIEVVHTGHIRGSIADHKIGRLAAELREDLLDRLLRGDVALYNNALIMGPPHQSDVGRKDARLPPASRVFGVITWRQVMLSIGAIS